jgi:hypothetical protein
MEQNFQAILNYGRKLFNWLYIKML